MTVDTAPAAPPTGDGSAASRKQLLVIVASVLGILALIAGAYALGSRTNHHTTLVLTGTAYVGDHVASVRVGNAWEYGIDGPVRWFDAQGGEHDGTWPPCLGPAGHDVRVRFGAVVVELPDGGKVRDVVWVDCG